MQPPPIVPGNTAPTPLPPPPPPPASARPRRGMSAGVIVAIVLGSTCLICAIGTASVLGLGLLRASPTSNGEATPVVEAPPAVQPSKTAAQPTQATSTAPAAGVPGLALEAASHIGLVSATHTPFLGFDAYQLTLSNGGTGWAINGTPDAVVPKVITDPSYSQTASVLFLSGKYVLYFPNLARMPEAFIVHTGPRPGMSVIDTDRYR